MDEIKEGSEVVSFRGMKRMMQTNVCVCVSTVWKKGLGECTTSYSPMCQ